MSSSSLMSSSSREYETLKFLLLKSVPGHGDVFRKVSERNLQPGDILLFPMNISPGVLSSSFKHAAVYCGDGEVIHFQNTSVQRNTGWISKEGYKAMKKERGKCQIYRKRGGIDPSDFHSKVRETMNSEARYHFGKNNCIHFALYLLGLVHFYTQLVEIPNEGGSCGGGARSSHMV
ncbi:uncharacterized protein LOC143165288 [Aptenodytes patagonicus]|uniref:uncharacterized protein LOC143165288 n=1 Tax=Aptenodytes patagonicus TaxID=9234 RepID=UPI003FA09392